MNPAEDDDPDTPEWLKPLNRTAITVMKETTTSDISKEMEERLEAALRAYDHDSGGWREVALQLLLQYNPAFQIRTPVDRLEVDGKLFSGAERSIMRWGLYGSMKTLTKRKGMSAAAAARELHKKNPEYSVGYLQNLLRDGEKGDIPPPRFMQRWKYEKVARDALDAAADKLAPPHV